MFLINKKIKKIKEYMDNKEELIDSMLNKLQLLDNTIEQVNSRIENTIGVMDNLKESYDFKIKELNKKIDINEEKRNTKVAVIIHLYYLDLWDEFKTYISNIHYDVDVYINLVDGSAARINLVNFKRNIEKEHKNYKVFINDNVGLDIGGTLNIMDFLIKEDKHYDYLLKMHSKKSIHNGRGDNKNGEIWRDELLKPIVGDYKTVNNVIDIFTENPIVGMVGSKKWIYDKSKNDIYKNSILLKSYINNYDINVDMNDLAFVGGSMFWVRYDIYKSFFIKNNPIKIIRTFEKNSFIDNRELKWTHAFERVLGLIILNDNKKILGV